MEQLVALIEPLLDFGILCGDREMRFADSGYPPRLLARAGVEWLAVEGMAELVRFDRLEAGQAGRQHGECENAGSKHAVHCARSGVGPPACTRGRAACWESGSLRSFHAWA